MNTSQISRKKVFVAATIASIGALAGSGVTYLLLQDNSVVSNAPGRSAIIKNKPELEGNIPDGTVSPTTIVANLNEYKDKEVKIRGTIIETAPGKYIIAGQEQDRPAAINLDFSNSNIDPTPYISGYTEEAKKASGSQKADSEQIVPVTLTGKVSFASNAVTAKITNLEK